MAFNLLQATSSSKLHCQNSEHSDLFTLKSRQTEQNNFSYFSIHIHEIWTSSLEIEGYRQKINGESIWERWSRSMKQETELRHPGIRFSYQCRWISHLEQRFATASLAQKARKSRAPLFFSVFNPQLLKKNTERWNKTWFTHRTNHLLRFNNIDWE